VPVTDCPVDHVIDYHYNSKHIFEIINNIRMNPEEYLKYLNKILSEVDDIHTLEELRISQELLEEIKNYLKDSNNMLKIQELKKFLSKMAVDKNSKTDPILWSEKVYHGAFEYLVESEEKTDLVDTELINRTTNQRITDKLKISTQVLEFNQDGYFKPELSAIKFLVDNKSKLENILVDNYQCGAFCNFPTRNSHTARTIFYFVNKHQVQSKLSGISTTQGNANDITIDEGLIENLPYRDDIIDGYYESDGTSLKAFFTLTNGDKKEEIFNL